MCLQIRPMEERDLPALCALLSGPGVMRYPEPPYSMEDPRRFRNAAGLAPSPPVYAAEDGRGGFPGHVIYRDHDERGWEIGFPPSWPPRRTGWIQNVLSQAESPRRGRF